MTEIPGEADGLVQCYKFRPQPGRTKFCLTCGRTKEEHNPTWEIPDLRQKDENRKFEFDSPTGHKFKPDVDPGICARCGSAKSLHLGHGHSAHSRKKRAPMPTDAELDRRQQGKLDRLAAHYSGVREHKLERFKEQVRALKDEVDQLMEETTNFDARSAAMVRTKLDEAEMWLKRGLDL